MESISVIRFYYLDTLPILTKMKVSLFLILLSFTFLTNAQVPDYFADAPEWQQSRLCYMNNDQENWDFVYYLNGDSVITNTTWHKVYKRGTYEVTGMGGSGGYSYNLPSFLVRQDSLKIFIINNSNIELLYDFELSVGDSLPITYNQLANNTIVDSIESIMINGAMRNKFYLSDSNFGGLDVYIIEGIGSNFGLFEPIDDILNCGNSFHCFSLNDIVEVGTDCNFDVSTQELITDIEITVAPNPVMDQLTISFPSAISLESVKCYSQEGREYELAIFQTSPGSISAELTNDIQGLFFVELQFGNDQIVRKKIVKL